MTKLQIAALVFGIIAALAFVTVFVAGVWGGLFVAQVAFTVFAFTAVIGTILLVLDL